jgi:dolichyl-phosphate beta-glucosyltransferase
MTSQPYLSIIIPSFRGSNILEKNLPFLLSFLSEQDFSFEIIIVDDGSNDGGKTEEVAKKYSCSYTANPINMGKGAAVRRGMLAANGRFRIFTDVDIPFETEAITKCLHYLDFKEFDIVVGDRLLPESSYFSEITKMRKFGSAIFTFIVGRFVTTGMFDTQCGIKGFRGEIADEIFSVSSVNSFTFDVELIYIALKRNLDIKRLPVKLRSNESSSISLLKHSPGMVLDLFKIKVNQIKGRYKKIKLQ